MSSTATTTEAAPTVELSTLPLRGREKKAEEKAEEYKYAHLLPHFSEDRYPPLEPYKHIDPGHRALKHANPRAFLDSAERVVELTPHLGTDVKGINLANLDSDGRDQLALEVGIFSVPVGLSSLSAF